jgi:hypothetical protein
VPNQDQIHQDQDRHQGNLVVSRRDLARAIHHWGCAGHGSVSGMTLTREASVLAEVLAIMDFERQDAVLLPRTSRPGALVEQALQSLQTLQTAQDGAASQAEEASREHYAAAGG